MINMETIKTTTDKAKEMRKEIKNQLGYTARQVSVKKTSYESICVTVKDYKVNFNEVEKIANQFEDVSYDEFTGEILLGGNTYIDVRNESINPEYLDKAKQIYEQVETNKKIKGTYTINDEMKVKLIVDKNDDLNRAYIQTKDKEQLVINFNEIKLANYMTMLL